MKYSTTYAAVIAMAVSYACSRFGLALDAKDPQLVQTVFDVMTAVAGIIALIERFRKGGVNPLGFKK